MTGSEDKCRTCGKDIGDLGADRKYGEHLLCAVYKSHFDKKCGCYNDNPSSCGAIFIATPVKDE